MIFPFMLRAQINLVTNGSFEQVIDYNSPFIDYKAVGWSGVDSLKFTASLYNTIYGNAPNTPVGYQMPKTGNGYIRMSLYCPLCGNHFTRSNLKNRLRKPLDAGKIYCAGMYVNRQEDCPKAIDGFGLYFGGNEIDTIKYNARLPLTFLTPQIQNPSGNIINDAINWIPVSGTFVATGGEKYVVIGNFQADAATSVTSTGFSSPNFDFSEYFVDHVSCIELNPQFGGPDTTIFPGDSLFLGKKNDDTWLDAKITWYQSPAPAAIDSTPGFWTKPAATTTYVVKQEICSYTIWDTVVIKIKEDDVLITQRRASRLQVFPIPAIGKLTIHTDAPSWFKDYTHYSICSSAGQMVNEGPADVATGVLEINTSDLPSGVYTLILSGEEKQPVTKRVLIFR